MRNSRTIIEGKKEFLKKALPHLCSYLPKDADLNVTIHFTAFIPSQAFAWEDIVICLDVPHWKKNVNNILNAIVYEIFHVGYSYYRNLRTGL